jgi:3-methyladenine DNA glycosylase AlkD
MSNIRAALVELSESKRAEHDNKYFRADDKGYGKGDKFLGVSVPDQRGVARQLFKETSLPEVSVLLGSEFHEERLTALFILCEKYQKSKTRKEKKELLGVYLDNLTGVNNWDLVDSSAPYLLGAYLYEFKDESRSILRQFAISNELWKQRIAIVATQYLIKQGEYTDTLKIARLLLDHKHDLIHKAVGWMLREVGNRDLEVEEIFLKKNYMQMPRTMLRYAIEKFPEAKRIGYLKGQI